MARRLDIWLPEYARGLIPRRQGRRARASRTTHLMLVVCDHFEPRHGVSSDGQPAQRLATWRREYPLLQQWCRDTYGTTPLHSFFYPPHHGDEPLPELAQMVFDGLGEVELHYHHNNDTAETFRRDLAAALQRYRRWGLLQQDGEPPARGFGFVHGDWALDNACGGPFCGVNAELSILQEYGCWADFTMPAGNECQTRKINSIYYAVDDPARSKSHDWGEDAKVGQTGQPGMLLMQGPLSMNWRAPGHPRIESASLTTENWGRPDRIATWVDCQVHVKGRPEWLFIKLHAHGAIERDFDALFGDRARAMHKELNEHYNDGKRFRLHYVTARQAYNIAKAAEAGHDGDPSQWLDYSVPPPVNRRYNASLGHRVDCSTDARLSLSDIDLRQPVSVRLAGGVLRQVQGRLSAIDLDRRAGQLRLAGAREGSEVTIDLAPGATMAVVSGARRLDEIHAPGRNQQRVLAGPQAILQLSDC